MHPRRLRLVLDQLEERIQSYERRVVASLSVAVLGATILAFALVLSPVIVFAYLLAAAFLAATALTGGTLGLFWALRARQLRVHLEYLVHQDLARVPVDFRGLG